MSHDHENEDCVTFVQEDEPINEFEENDQLMYSAFPHLFPLGRGLRKNGSIPMKDMRHMELQWHGKFASCLRLLFLFFDQWQRHITCQSIQTTVRSNKLSMDIFSQMVADPEFLNQLEKAKNNPNHPKSMELLAKITPHLSLVSKKVPYSVAARSSTVGHLMGMVRYFGPPSIFYTHSPDDTNGLLNLRFTLPMTNNWSFPSTESGFAEAMRNHHSDFHGISLSESAKKMMLALGPVSSARMFQIMTEAFFVHMLGTPPNGTGKKKSIPLSKRQAGIFGTPVASFGCTEEQARGSLHMHILFWGGLTPNLLQAAGGIPGLKNYIAEAINRVVSAQLDPTIHLKHLLRDMHNEKPPHAAFFKPHHPVREKKQYIQDFQRTVDLCNIHQHGPPCFKKKIGKTCCQQGRGVRLRDETGCLQIIAKKTDPSQPEVSFEVLPSILPPDKFVTSKRNFSRVPVALRDKRMIMYFISRPAILPPLSTEEDRKSPPSVIEKLILPSQLQEEFDLLGEQDKEKISQTLQKRNAMVVEYNPLASAVLGCNTNAAILGSDVQSKSALCYLIKYVSKPPAELAHSLTLLYLARKTIDEYPSKADDSGSIIRTGIHYLNKIANDLSGAIEISGPMAAAAVLGMPAETSSETFWVTYIHAAISFVTQHPETISSCRKTPDEEFADLRPDLSSEYQDEEINKSNVANSVEEENLQRTVEISDDETTSHEDTSNQDKDQSIFEELFIEKHPLILASSLPQTDDNVNSTANIYVTPRKIIAVPQHLHYAYRGTHLQELSLYEYTALIDIVPMRSKTKTKSEPSNNQSAPGRPANGTFVFTTAHSLHGKIKQLDFTLSKHQH